MSEKAHAHVAALLAEPELIDIGNGRREPRIPGPDCHSCKGTGYVMLHGAPISRYGPRMDAGCPSCRRSPNHWLGEVCVAKMVQIVLRDHPELR